MNFDEPRPIAAFLVLGLGNILTWTALAIAPMLLLFSALGADPGPVGFIVVILVYCFLILMPVGLYADGLRQRHPIVNKVGFYVAGVIGMIGYVGYVIWLFTADGEIPEDWLL